MHLTNVRVVAVGPDELDRFGEGHPGELRVPPAVVRFARRTLEARGVRVTEGTLASASTGWSDVGTLERASRRDATGSSVVVGLGPEARMAAAAWALGTRRNLVLSDDDVPDLTGFSSVVFVLSPRQFSLNNLIALNRRMAGRKATYSIVPALENDVAVFAAAKRHVNAMLGSAPRGRLLLAPADSPIPPVEGARVLIGPQDASLVTKEITSPLDLLCVVAHSNGLDALFGDGLFFCSNTEYGSPPSRPGKGDLLPCFSGARCNRGTGRLLRAHELRARVVAFFVCGGLVPNGGTFDPRFALSQQLLANSYTEAFFASIAIFEGGGRVLLECAAPFLAESTTGLAARAFTERLRLREPEGAEGFFLVGDPDLPLSQLSTTNVDTADVGGTALRLAFDLPAGDVVRVRAPAPAGDAALFAEYSVAAFDSVRAHVGRDRRYLDVLVSSPGEPIDSFELSLTPELSSPRLEPIRDILRRLAFTRRYLILAGGSDAQQRLHAEALEAVDQLESQLLMLGVWGARAADPSTAFDTRTTDMVTSNWAEMLTHAHGALLVWQLAFAAARGSQPRKNWNHLLVETKRKMLPGGCVNCAHDLTVSRHESPIDPRLSRISLSCLRCWHAGDLSDEALPWGLSAPQEVCAGTSLDIKAAFHNTSEEPWHIHGAFLLEDFHGDGPYGSASESLAFSIPPSARGSADGRLAIREDTPAGRYIVSFHFCVNGSLNVLRRPLSLERGTSCGD